MRQHCEEGQQWEESRELKHCEERRERWTGMKCEKQTGVKWVCDMWESGVWRRGEVVVWWSVSGEEEKRKSCGVVKCG